MNAINHEEKMSEYRQFIEGFVKEGRLLTIFIELMKGIRRVTRNSKKRIHLIFITLEMLREICNDTIKCHKCLKTYQFRHCQNPKSRGNGVYHVIELSCKFCGDYYTFNENKKRVSYFNIYVLEKVSHLKRRGKNLLIVTDRSIPHNAVVVTSEEVTKLPVLKINDRRVKDAIQVKNYWDKAKSLQKSLRSGRRPMVDATKMGGKNVYYL